VMGRLMLVRMMNDDFASKSSENRGSSTRTSESDLPSVQEKGTALGYVLQQIEDMDGVYIHDNGIDLPGALVTVDVSIDIKPQDVAVNDDVDGEILSDESEMCTELVENDDWPADTVVVQTIDSCTRYWCFTKTVSESPDNAWPVKAASSIPNEILTAFCDGETCHYLPRDVNERIADERTVAVVDNRSDNQ